MLLDIGLPLLSGYEVCRRLREQPWGRQITVIALTGWGDQDAVQKGETAGFDRHLVKPVDEAVLVATLAGLPPPKSRIPPRPDDIDSTVPPRSAATPLPCRHDGAGVHPPDDRLRRRDDDDGGPGIPSGPTVPPAPGVAGPAWWGFGRDAQHSAVSAHRHPGPQPHRLVDAARPGPAIQRQRRASHPLRLAGDHLEQHRGAAGEDRAPAAAFGSRPGPA